MRYFTRFDGQGVAYRLYRFEVQSKKILEEYWTPKGWEHDQDARIVGYLSIGEPDLDEISEAHAQNLFPIAFGLPASPQEDSIEGIAFGKKEFFRIPEGFFDSDEKHQSKFIEQVIESSTPEGAGEKTRRPIRYRVHLEGSSIYGTLSDIDDYKRAQNLLQEKLDKGKLECFKWWCKECDVTPLASAAIPDRHVLKISIPNVIKIIAESKVDWQWRDPDSEWAKSHGAPKDAFTDIVKRKSRPNWVIRISAEAAGIDYVFKN
jgi:hypothetical protein